MRPLTPSPIEWHPQQLAWFQPGHALGSLPTPGTLYARCRACLPSVELLPTPPPVLSLSPREDVMGVFTSPAQTIGQECMRFRTNTAWARTIALDLRPRNTFHRARAPEPACPSPPTSFSVPATWRNEAGSSPHPKPLNPQVGSSWLYPAPFLQIQVGREGVCQGCF